MGRHTKWQGTMCWICDHRLEGRQRCSAFPEGIPDAIFRHGMDYRLPYPGDRGLRFVPEPGVSADDVAAVLAVYDETEEDTDTESPDPSTAEPS